MAASGFHFGFVRIKIFVRFSSNLDSVCITVKPLTGSNLVKIRPKMAKWQPLVILAGLSHISLRRLYSSQFLSILLNTWIVCMTIKTRTSLNSVKIIHKVNVD